MTQFVCPERRAKATLSFPILTMEFENKWPKVQEHEVFRVTLYKHHYGRGTELRGADMPDISGFLSELNPSLIQLKTWDFDYFDLTLVLTEPVAVGEHANVMRIAMTYYGGWANTAAMRAAHAAWRARVGM
jgi:hypothetical protein